MNFKVNKSILGIGLFTIALFSCDSDDDNRTKPTPPDVVTIAKEAVITNYADIVYQSYNDSYNSAINLKNVLNDFVLNPSAEGFEASKTAWLAAREIYGQTEAYRGANGPIDTPDQPWSIDNEGQMNAWPMEEALVDYVIEGSEGSGEYGFDIISDTSLPINEETIINFNAFESNEASVTTGWHAIEFLLWGQDYTLPSENLAGQREFTDYTTADNADRRGDYLNVAANLLTKDLLDLVNTWNVGGTYRTVFDNLDEDTAISQFIFGAFFIAGDELSGERMYVAVDSDGGIGGLGQEDEHSCFSDNTNRDVFANAKGVYNVIFGEYGSINGDSFYDLVVEADAVQAQKLLDAGNEAIEKATVVGNNSQPFDLLITQESVENGQIGPVIEAARALEDWANEISASASAIGIDL
jgi:putative iron-regulated protein